MKTQKGNVAVIVLIIVVVAITAGIIGWMLAKKSQVSVPQPEVLTTLRSTKAIQPVEKDQQSVTQPTPVGEAVGWQTYTDTNTEFKFSFEYPKNWLCKNSDGNSSAFLEKGVGVICISTVRQKEFDADADFNNKVDGLFPDLLIQFVDAKTIDEYFNDPLNQKIGNINLSGKPAYEVHIGGMSQNYGVVVESGGKVLELMFLAWEKKDIGENEKHIISSFKFIN